MRNLAISKKKRTTRKFLSKRTTRKFLSKRKRNKTYRKKKYLKGGYRIDDDVEIKEKEAEIKEQEKAGKKAQEKIVNEDKNITKGFIWGYY
jgi:hypothetical protein